MGHLSERSVRGRLGLGWMVSVVAALLLSWGCGESGSPAPAPVVCAAGEVVTPEGTCRVVSCPPGELLLESGVCQPAGLPPDMPCPPGEWPSADGTCQAAGVPPEACAEGFEPDGNGGCNAILPAEACPFGQMAVPGETSCREVAPCGDGPWGTIPVEANTQFVDQAYAGGDSDGTMAKPWTTVQQGVDAAAGGAIVAVTDGVYEEEVRIEGKAVRLWGRCPGLVEIRGTGAWDATIEVSGSDASGTGIRSVAVTGPRNGITVSDASDVEIERVRVHDAGGRGIAVQDMVGDPSDPTSAKVGGSLIEQNHDVGLIVEGSTAEVVATVVRTTQPDGDSGIGIVIVPNPHAIRADVSVRGCVVERNHHWGVFARQSDVELAATVVRGTLTGQGIFIWAHAKVLVRGCVVEQNHEAGVLVSDSAAEIEATVVRTAQPVNGYGGHGIQIQSEPAKGERAVVSVRGCLVEQNHEAGVVVINSEARLEATAVRSTQPGDALGAAGIIIQNYPGALERSDVSVSGCVVEQNHDMGVFVRGSDAELVATVVRSTQPVNGQSGRGVSIQVDPNTGAPSDVSIRRCVVEQNNEFGIVVTLAGVTLEASVVRDTAANADGSFGDGIVIENGTATIQSTTISGSARAGVASWGSDVTILASSITCNTFDLNGETHNGALASFDGSADWQCSRAGAEDCTETDTCHVLSAGLEPPPAIEPF